jgi:hypothetical protein
MVSDKKNLHVIMAFLILTIFLVEYVSTGKIIPEFNTFDNEPLPPIGGGVATTSVVEIPPILEDNTVIKMKTLVTEIV